MEVNELRVGNIISALGKTETIVTYINSDDNMIGSTDFADRPIEDFHPIPITEEWLLKFGYRDIGEGWFMHDVNIIQYNFKTKIVNPMILGIKIEHIHQLQNLYFSLTGQELTITTNGTKQVEKL